MIYSISLIQRWPFCFTSIIFETGMHLIIDVASKTSWQCVPCWFFACFLVRYIQTLHLTIRGDVCVCVCVCVCVSVCVSLCFSCSDVSSSFVTPWTVARQAPQSMGFPRPEYWSRLPFAPPGDLPNPRIQPTSPALAGGFFTTESPGKPLKKYIYLKILFSPHIPQCSYFTAKEMGVQKTCGQNHGVSSLPNSGQVLFCISGGIFVGKQT